MKRHVLDRIKWVLGPVFVLMAICSTAGATSPSAGEPNTLRPYLEALRNLPANKQQLLRQVVEDFGQESTQVLEAFLLSSSSFSVDALLNALEKRQEPGMMNLYLNELGSDEGTRLKLIASIFERLQKSPQKLKRMQDSVSEIQNYLELERKIETDLGLRAFSFSILFADIIAIYYSTYSTYIDYADVKSKLINGAPYISFLAISLLVLPAIKETTNLFKSWKLRYEEFKSSRQRRRNLKFLDQVLEELAKNPSLLEAARVNKYLRSAQGEKAAFEAFAALEPRVSEVVARAMTLNPGDPRLNILMRLARKMSARFSPVEIQYLRDITSQRSAEAIMPSSLQFKLASAGAETLAELEEVREESGLSKSEFYDHTLSFKKQTRDELIRRAEIAALPMKLNVAGLTVASVLLSVYIAVGLAPSELDHRFLFGFGAWLRDKGEYLRLSVGGLAVIPWLYHVGLYVQSRLLPRSNQIQTYYDWIEAGVSRLAARPWLRPSRKVECESALLSGDPTQP